MNWSRELAFRPALTKKWLVTKADSYLASHPHDFAFIKKVLGRKLSTYIWDARSQELAAPWKKYVILFTPRSGSTVLSEYVAATQKMGYPLEYFVEWIAQAIGLLRVDAEQPLLQFIQQVFQSPNGVFGLELEWDRLQQEIHSFEDFRGWSVFYLTRRDKVMQAISLRRAVEGSVWHSLSQPCTEPAYDRAAIVSYINRLLLWERYFEKLFIKLRIDPYRIYYEDIQANFSKVVREIANQLGVEESFCGDACCAEVISGITRTPESDLQARRVMSAGGQLFGYDILENDIGALAVLSGLDLSLVEACDEPLVFRALSRPALKARIEGVLNERFPGEIPGSPLSRSAPFEAARSE
jgi:LPS sulfotransferase NodH